MTAGGRGRRARRVKRWAWATAFMAISPWAQAQTPGAVPLPNDPNVQVLEQLANAPDGRVDYAKVQIAIERALNPAFDAVPSTRNWTIGPTWFGRGCPRVRHPQT